jgi:hypothetical protein
MHWDMLRFRNHLGNFTDMLARRLLLRINVRTCNAYRLGHFTRQRTIQEITPVDPLEALETLTLDVVLPELV